MMFWVALVAFGKGEKWTDLGDILEGDLIEVDTWSVSRNEEEDEIKHNFQVYGPSPQNIIISGKSRGKEVQKAN